MIVLLSSVLIYALHKKSFHDKSSSILYVQEIFHNVSDFDSNLQIRLINDTDAATMALRH